MLLAVHELGDILRLWTLVCGATGSCWDRSSSLFSQSWFCCCRVERVSASFLLLNFLFLAWTSVDCSGLSHPIRRFDLNICHNLTSSLSCDSNRLSWVEIYSIIYKRKNSPFKPQKICKWNVVETPLSISTLMYPYCRSNKWLKNVYLNALQNHTDNKQSFVVNWMFSWMLTWLFFY